MAKIAKLLPSNPTHSDLADENVVGKQQAFCDLRSLLGYMITDKALKQALYKANYLVQDALELMISDMDDSSQFIRLTNEDQSDTVERLVQLIPVTEKLGEQLLDQNEYDLRKACNTFWKMKRCGKL